MSPARRPRWSRAAHLLAYLLVLAWLVPLAGMLVTSLRTPEAAARSGWWSLRPGAELTLENYRAVLAGSGDGSGGMWSALLNTFAIAVPAVCAALLVAALAAYALAYLPLRNRPALLAVLAALMVLPLQAVLIPLFELSSGGASLGGLRLLPDLGMLQGRLSLWLAHTAIALPLMILVLRSYLLRLPRTLLEAAAADGAGHLSTFWRIVVPQSAPALVALGTFQFLWIWNDFLVALTLLGGSDAEAPPVALQLAIVIERLGPDLHLVSAAAATTMIVPLVLFATLHRRWVAGLRASFLDY